MMSDFVNRRISTVIQHNIKHSGGTSLNAGAPSIRLGSDRTSLSSLCTVLSALISSVKMIAAAAGS